MDALLESLSVLERGVVKALLLDGAALSLEHHKLVLAYPPFHNDGTQPLHKTFERLPNGQWQQVLCVDMVAYDLCSITPFDLEEVEWCASDLLTVA